MSKSTIVTLPPERWREVRHLRLEALLDTPTAFAASYEEESALSEEVWIARLTTAYERDGNMTFFAEVDGALVGMAGANWPARAKLRHVAEVYSVYMSPAQRGTGLASRLLQTLLDELRRLDQIEKVRLAVTAGSPAPLRLYQKLGFEIVGTARRELKIDGRYYDLHMMELHF